MWLRCGESHPSSLKAEWHLPLRGDLAAHPPHPASASFSDWAFSVTKPISQLVDEGRRRQIQGCLGTFADPSLGPVLLKATLGVQFNPFCTKRSPVEAPTNCGLLISSNRLRKAKHRQHMFLAYIRVPPKRPSAPSGQPQKTSEQNPTSFTNSISKVRLLQKQNSAERNTAFCLFYSYFSVFFLIIFLLFFHFLCYSLFFLIPCYIFIFSSLFLFFILLFIFLLLLLFWGFFFFFTTCTAAACHGQDWVSWSARLQVIPKHKKANSNRDLVITGGPT